MSCEILNFAPTICTATTVNLCDVASAGNYSVKLIHTGNKKTYWFDAPLAATIQLDLSSFDVDIDMPYEFEVYDLSSSLNTPLPFGAFGASTFDYTKGRFSFYGAKTAGETLPTTTILQAL